VAGRGYEDAEIYKLAKKLAVEIHKMTLTELPKYEMFAEGDQIRRSSKSIVANFVEGYGRRRYPPDHIRFLTYAVSTCDETKRTWSSFTKPRVSSLIASNTFMPNTASWAVCFTTIARLPSKARSGKINLSLATCDL
jgi:four helix bundle protein